MEGKDGFAFQSFSAALDPADVGVAILYRKGKIACHERCTHPLELASGHLSAQHESLRAAADRAVERTDAYFIALGCRDVFLTDFDLTRSAIPKGRGDIGTFAKGHFPQSRAGITRTLTCYKR